MRTSHPDAPRLAVLGLALLGLGCAGSVDAAFDPGEDFSRFHVWSFEPSDDPRVEAPGRSELALDAQLRRLIHRAMGARGYHHGRERPDFFVRYHLSLQPTIEVVRIPLAPYLLSSMSSSPSYWIEGSDTEERRYDDLRLAIDVSTGSGKVVWKAGMRERLDYGRRPRLDLAVTDLLERFPKASPRPDPGLRPPDQLARLDRPARPEN